MVQFLSTHPIRLDDHRPRRSSSSYVLEMRLTSGDNACDRDAIESAGDETTKQLRVVFQSPFFIVGPKRHREQTARNESRKHPDSNDMTMPAPIDKCQRTEQSRELRQTERAEQPTTDMRSQFQARKDRHRGREEHETGNH